MNLATTSLLLRTHGMRAAVLALAIPAFGLSLLSGCGALGGSSNAAETPGPPLSPVSRMSPIQTAGTIVRLDEVNRLVVFEKSLTRPEANPIGRIYVSLDNAGNPTAVLQASQVEFGRYGGFYILEGNPQPGQRVIVPVGPAFEAFLAPYRNPAPPPNN